MDRLEEDLELLEAAGEADLIREFYSRFSRVEQLERDIEELREQFGEGQ